MNMREQFKRAPYNHLIKKLNICNMPLSESEEYDIWQILSMYLIFRVQLYKINYTFPKPGKGSSELPVVMLQYRF